MKKLIINLALFQIGWLVCVVGGNVYAVAFTLLALLVHYFLILNSPAELKLIALVVVVGSLWDVAMVKIGAIGYADSSIFGIPLWLVCLWTLFATTFMHSLWWLHRHLPLAVVLAALFGPTSYWMGSQLTEAQFGFPLVTSLAVMALGWAFLFPCGIYYAGKWKSI